MSNHDFSKIKDFYDDRYALCGNSIKSVGWGDHESQQLRFDKLCRNFNFENKVIFDFGCGFADLITYLENTGSTNFGYIGLDVSQSLLNEAKKKYFNRERTSFFMGNIFEIHNELPVYDIALLSGALTFKVDNHLNYVHSVLKLIFDKSTSGMSVNFLSSYSDYQLEKNFHAIPEEMFSFAKTLSKKVNLIHDYDLYEFTLQILK